MKNQVKTLINQNYKKGSVKTQVLGLGFIATFLLLSIITYGTFANRHDIQTLAASNRDISDLKLTCGQCRRAAESNRVTSLCLDSSQKRSYCVEGIQRPSDSVSCVACSGSVSVTPTPVLSGTPVPSGTSITPTGSITNGEYKGVIKSVTFVSANNYMASVELISGDTYSMYNLEISDTVKIDASVPVDTTISPFSKQLYELFNSSDSARRWARGATYVLTINRNQIVTVSLASRPISSIPSPSIIVGECGWCGTTCVSGPISPDRACPMVMPPTGSKCVWNPQSQRCVRIDAVAR